MKCLITLTTTILIILSLSFDEAKAQDVAGTRLHEAAVNGDIEKVRTLISEGADVNYKNRLGWTPIHTATRNRRQNIVELLIEKGADINGPDNRGWTPLHFAAEIGNIAIVELLIEKGADLNIETKDKQNALTIARSNNRQEIARLLMRSGAQEPAIEEEKSDEAESAMNATEQGEQLENSMNINRSRITRGASEQTEAQIDLLDDPNEIKERIKTFEGLEKDIEKIDVNSTNEMRKWKQIRNDNRSSLIKDVEKQYSSEIGLIQKIAVEEKAEKTVKAIDDMVTLRIERFTKIRREVLLQRREQREAERETQNTRGRARTTGRETRGRVPQRGQTTGAGTEATTYGRGPVMNDSRRTVAEVEPTDQIEEETQEEIDLWLGADIGEKESLADSVYQLFLNELRSVREVAVEEEAKKTTAAIDGILLARQERLDAVILEIAQERERLALREAQTQGQDTRGRGRRGRGTTGTGRTSQQDQTRTRDRRR